MKTTNNRRKWRLGSIGMMHATAALLAGAIFSPVGCKQDAPTGEALRTANTSVSLVQSARSRCPDATEAIANAESAGAAAREAGNAVAAAGAAVDKADIALTSAERGHESAGSERFRTDKALEKLEKERDEMQKDYLAANEKMEEYRVQAALAGLDMSDANTNGMMDRMKAGMEVPVAMANYLKAKAERDRHQAQHDAAQAKYREAIRAARLDAEANRKIYADKEKVRDNARTKADEARTAYRAAVSEANEKTKAARAANAALARACPDAQAEVYPEGTRLPGSQPEGLDIFRDTTVQHQEP